MKSSCDSSNCTRRCGTPEPRRRSEVVIAWQLVSCLLGLLACLIAISRGYGQAVTVTAAPATSLYVATTGSDANAGTKESPLLTLAAARDKIRARKAAGQFTGPVTVYLRGGTHRLTETFALTEADSGTASKRITYRNYPGETATISGAKVVSGTWQTYSGSIKYLDLPGQADFRSLWVNGVAATRAREPEAGSYYAMEPYGGGEGTVDDYYWATPADLPTIGAGETIELMAYVGFLQSRSFISSIEASGTPRKVNVSGGPTYGFNYRSDYGRYYLENSRSFIDSEGEFYFDAANDRLYYWPRAGQNLSTATVEVPAVKQLLSVTGSTNEFTPPSDSVTYSYRFKSDYANGADFWEQNIWNNRLSGASGVRLSIRKQAGTTAFPFIYIGSSDHYATAAANLTDGQWHHVAAVLNGSTIVIYVDGSQVYSAALTSPAFGSDAPRIGGKINPDDVTFDGELADVIVVNKACTAGEVADLRDQDYGALDDLFIFQLPLDTDFAEATGAMGEGANHVRYTEGGTTTVNREPQLTGDGAALFDGVDDHLDFYQQPGERAKYLSFKGLAWKNADWELLAGGHWTWESGYNSLESRAIELTRAQHCLLSGGSVRQVGGVGVVLTTCLDCSLDGVTISDVGGSGVVDNGGAFTLADVICGRNAITDCTISGVGQVNHGGCGVVGEFSRELTIEHNEISEAPYSGVRLFANLDSVYQASGGNSVQWNEIYGVMQKLSDGAGVYVSGRQPGTEVAYNLIYGIPQTADHTAAGGNLQELRGLYADDGCSGVHWHRNVVHDVYQPLFLHQPNNIEVANNVFVDGEIASGWMVVSSNPYGDGSVNTYPVGVKLTANIFANTGGAPLLHLIATSANYLSSTVGLPFADSNRNLYGEDDFQDTLSGVTTSRNLAYFRSTHKLDPQSAVGDPQLGADYMPERGSPAYATGFEAFDLSEIGPQN